MMTLIELTEFFKWMTIINFSLFLFSLILTLALKKTAYQLQGKLFGINEESVSIVMYGYFGAYKIFFLFFNVVPYTALLCLKSIST